ncbi:MAG: hypothetical protein V1495_08670 [Pseudomonadota bacterium]
MKESPLSEVVRDRRFNEILASIRRSVQQGESITISPREVDYIRRTFHRGIRMGERRLHRLARALLSRFAPRAELKTHYVGWGKCSHPEHVEILKNQVPITDPKKELYDRADTDLAIEHLPVCPRCGFKSTNILSFVQYKPEPVPKSGLALLSTRIKTTSNLCYKVTDMVFDIDRMFRHDKFHGQFSQIVADVYGVKAVFRTETQMWDALTEIRKVRSLSVLEEKDYVGERKKNSGFEVYKVLAKNQGQLFEIQFQSKRMFEHEESSLPASHRTYKERQMADRRKLGKEYLEVFRALTQLFARPDQNYCDIGYIELGYTGKGLDDEF